MTTNPGDGLSLAPLDPAPTQTAPAAASSHVARTCPRCHYTRQASDTAPAWQCPRCAVVYDKATPRPRARAGHDEDDDTQPVPLDPRRARASAGLPWAWIALGSAVLAGAALLGWKWNGERQRSAQQVQRAASDSRAADVSQARAMQDGRARIDALEHQWRMGEGAQALPAVRALADEGEPRAMVLLGSMLLGGSSYRNAIGQPLDPAEALQWLERAARAGDATAAVRLGGLYERGEHVPRQPSLAENWYLRAARQGDGAGLYSLGMLYARGADPVSQRPVPAWMLLTLAERASRAAPVRDALLTEQHYPSSARAGLVRLKDKLHPSDIAEAERLADAWMPGQPLGF